MPLHFRISGAALHEARSQRDNAEEMRPVDSRSVVFCVYTIDRAECGCTSTQVTRASGGIGRRAGFSCQCLHGRGGSSPPSRTEFMQPLIGFPVRGCCVFSGPMLRPVRVLSENVCMRLVCRFGVMPGTGPGGGAVPG